MVVNGQRRSHPAVSHVSDTGGVNLKDPAAFSYGCSFGRQEG